ncbi:hypothetical protein [Flavobacterium reichenbachii]|uniref:Lipoprotein n=1 Tax=Flavobacterium reichenbachii TaxID=362418 RepID=A0A085ZMU6_9FLAO|nr:hypothetical protein [Flavobacterium reichenbachii]KFF05760.1 hypothetical protein IW19_09615 [Flavobacterium reichenbachii]OXB12649.1 hypothetical protein B0A68_17825 [Flavobacterium reichenbachii]
MNKLLTLLILVFFLQSCENKPKEILKNSSKKKDKTEEWTKEKDRELAGSLYAKFDNDSLDDDFKILKNEDEIVQSVLSIFLTSQKKEIKINLLNNSILYNKKESAYYTFFTVTDKKVCNVRIEYADQESIPNISGEKKNLVEKIKCRFNTKNQKTQVIGYELSYQKDTKFITKSFNFLTGKYIAAKKDNGKTSTVNGWSAELENIYAENWDFPFLRDKIYWYGEAVE